MAYNGVGMPSEAGEHYSLSIGYAIYINKL
jgi:hypothetical protein